MASLATELRPRGRAVGVALGSALFLFLGLLVGVGMALDPKVKGNDIARVLFAVAVLGLWPSSLLVAVAGVVDGRTLPRGLLILVGGALALVGGVLMGISASLDSRSPSGFGGGLFCGLCYAGPFFFIGVQQLFAGLAAIREGRGPEAVAAVVALLEERGAATFAELSAASGVPVEKLPRTLQAAELRIIGRILSDAEGGWAIRSSAEAEALERLPGIVQAAGRITFADLARELRIPAVLLRRQLQASVGAQRLRGAIDWERGVVLARAAGRTQEGAPCLSCGGALNLAGLNLLRCPHCGAQIVL